MNNEITTKIRGLLPKKAFDYLLYGVFIVAIIALIDLYSDINEHEDNWHEFKQQHHCELTKTETGNNQASWRCDDGKIYYRWRQVLR